MTFLDFTNPQNKKKGLGDVSKEYIEEIKKLALESSYYPKFHIAPKCGLMNDPNGLCQIDGWYHIFYQWFPLGPVHGLKHWYHLKTKDFVNYTDMGVAVYPDSDIDCCGSYTGVISGEENGFKVYYTGVDINNGQNTLEADFDGENRIFNKKICVKRDDSLTTNNYRDPCIYKNFGKTFMLVGAESKEGKGIIIVYEKKDGDFLYKGLLKIPGENNGYMFECPNMVKMDDDTDLLMFSPQGIESPDKYTYRNVFSVVYAAGKFIPETNEFKASCLYEVDKGFDFYAPQIFTDNSGRKIMLAWLGNSKCVYPSDSEQWAHMMTLPRQLWTEKGVLFQRPLEELKALRESCEDIKETVFVKSKCLELELKAEENFSIKICNSIGNYVSFSGNEKEYCLDRSKMSHIYNEKFGTERYAERTEKTESLRIFIDKSSIEIFAGKGSVCFTSRMYIDNIDRIIFEGCKGKIYSLKPLNIR